MTDKQLGGKMMSENTTNTEKIEESTVAEKAAAEETVKEEPEKKASAAKKSFINDNTIEIVVAVLLGVTALLTAWATWIGSLHGGNQATNYARSNIIASEGNSEYNAGMQLYLSDVMVWNTLMEYAFDSTIAEAEGDTEKVSLIEEKIDNYADENGSTILAEGIEWMDSNEDATSPFDMPGITDKYFENANQLLEESRQLLEQGKTDNSRGDTYNLVSVIYSVVLFMLGIVGIFKRIPNRAVVVIIALIALIAATVFMCTIPLPTGFDITSFFGAK